MSVNTCTRKISEVHEQSTLSKTIFFYNDRKPSVPIFLPYVPMIMDLSIMIFYKFSSGTDKLKLVLIGKSEML